MERPGGNRRDRWRSRGAAAAAGALAFALALSVAACGGDDSSSNSNEASGTFPVKIVTAEFPPRQRLAETSLLQLGIRNTGRKTMPALTVTVSIAGKEGEGSSLPFGIHDPQPGLAQPDRPVWVLSARYPKLFGSEAPAGAETWNRKTFDFGPLKPGKTVDAVWKLTAVRTGEYTLRYGVGAGLTGSARAENAAGTEPGGTFRAQISEVPADTEVTDSGEVVEIETAQGK